MWHAALPVVAYAVLLAAGVVLRRNEMPALFTIGAVSLLLVFIGIHNAWDTVMYLTLQRSEGSSASPTQRPSPRPEV